MKEDQRAMPIFTFIRTVDQKKKRKKKKERALSLSPAVRTHARTTTTLHQCVDQFFLRRELPAPGTKGGLFCICVGSRNLT